MKLIRVFQIALLLVSGMPYFVCAQGADSAQTDPRIEAFHVNEVRRIEPGVVFRFSVYGSKASLAVLGLEGAAHNIQLVELAPGGYVGSYTVQTEDFISASSTLTISLASEQGKTHVVLKDVLVVGDQEMPRNTGLGPKPEIQHFHVAPFKALTNGSQLQFVLEGTSGAAVSVGISGLEARVLLTEVGASGRYLGSYTIRAHDQVTPYSVVTTSMRLGGHVTRVSMGQAFQALTAPMPILGVPH